MLYMTGCHGRTDEDRSQYTGALCGLGWDPSTGKGLYEDHDLECTFDTVFTQEDLDQVRAAILLIQLASSTCHNNTIQWKTSAGDNIGELIANCSGFVTEYSISI